MRGRPNLRSKDCSEVKSGSTLVPVRAGQYEVAKSFKVVSGGTLFVSPIIGVSLSGAQAGSLIVNGYFVGGSEIVNVGPASFYLSAAGATAVVHMFVGYSSGYTSIA
jgi:hypothetical protein